jgi:hypothetical protein
MADAMTEMMTRLALGNSPGLAGLVRLFAPAPALNQQALARAALAAAGGLLAPNLSRYPIGAMQRVGLGLGAGLQALGRAPLTAGDPAASALAPPHRRARLALRARGGPRPPARRRPRPAFPATLGGGWTLYSLDKRSGKPVYLGPNGALRVYG